MRLLFCFDYRLSARIFQIPLCKGIPMNLLMRKLCQQWLPQFLSFISIAQKGIFHILAGNLYLKYNANAFRPRIL